MPLRPNWVATDLVSWATPALDTPYAVHVNSPAKAVADEVLMTLPPPDRSIAGIECLQPNI
jgi:hypothetical protein